MRWTPETYLVTGAHGPHEIVGEIESGRRFGMHQVHCVGGQTLWQIDHLASGGRLYAHQSKAVLRRAAAELIDLDCDWGDYDSVLECSLALQFIAMVHNLTLIGNAEAGRA